MRITDYLLALVLLILTPSLVSAQCQCDYDIDVDGDTVPEGKLYRDIVYPESDLVIYKDGDGLPSITYATNRETYDGSLVDLKMDVYYPTTTDTCALKDKPVIFFFYGGGFTVGTSNRVKNLCREYATRGYVTVAPNYRLGFTGAYDGDTMHVCEDLLGPAKATVRALQDAEAAIVWMKQFADTLGLDIDTNKMFVHGPSIFPMVGMMNEDEMPPALSFLGSFNDNAKVAGAVGRSTAINLINRFIDSDDMIPLLMFHGTCDKSVPFFKTSAYKRYGCADVLPISVTGDYLIYGPEIIKQKLPGYYEFYPFCGLHHSLKDVEAGVMKEIVAEFFYNIYCGNIVPTDPPKTVPFKMADCDVSGKCVADDWAWSYCDSATQLPPLDTADCATGYVLPSDQTWILREDHNDYPRDMRIFPNPSQGSFMLTFRSQGEEVAVVRLFDLMGRLVHETQVDSLNEGINLRKVDVPGDIQRGVYLVEVNGFIGPKVVIQ